jgi:hypothetical protein
MKSSQLNTQIHVVTIFFRRPRYYISGRLVGKLNRLDVPQFLFAKRYILTPTFAPVAIMVR